VIVASPLPPDAAPAAAQAAVSIVTATLARLGRDVTQSRFVDELERTYRLDMHVLPPITWSANQHNGTTVAWLMTLDATTQRLMAKPGWVRPP
jgi:hypothetical protein